jgi:hypothetical protein
MKKRSVLVPALLALFVLGVTTLSALVSDYSFTSTSGTYTEITGGTVLGTAANDNESFDAIPLGFSFIYDDVSYAVISVQSNGFLALGSSVLVSNLAISSATGTNNVVAALNRDLRSRDNGELMYLLSGDAPNRIFAVQWKNYKRYPTSAANDTLNFQIQLQENGYKVVFAYGYFKAMEVSTAATVQVGLRGASNLDFNNRTTTTDWTATLAGTANNANCRINSIVYPSNGLTFTFSPSVVGLPPNPAGLVYPANGAINVSPLAMIRWASGGGLPTGYRIYFGTDSPPSNLLNNVDLGAANSYDPDPDLSFLTTYYWKIIPYNDYGDATGCPEWSFTTHGDQTITSLPYTQAFDAVSAPDLPWDWSGLIQPANASAIVATYASSPHSTPNCVRLYNATVTTNSVMLIAPPLPESVPANNTRLHLWTKGAGTLSIGVMSNPNDASTYQQMQSISLTSGWVEHTIYLNGYTGTGRYIAVKHGQGSSSQYIYVDDATIEEIPEHDLAATGLTGALNASVNNPTSYSISVCNRGYVTEGSYTVKLYDNLDNELASATGLSVVPDATVEVPVTWTPTTEGAIVIHARVVLAGDGDAGNDQFGNLNITVFPEGVMEITVGTGSENMLYPFDFYYKNSLYETLYFPAEIGTFGNIFGIRLYNNFTTNLPNKPVKIWMGSTILSNLSAGYIPSTQLTLVFDGMVSFPSGVNTITIPLQTTFPYVSGNLVVMFNRPLDTAYFSQYDYFKGQTVGANRARRAYDDTTVFDPANPPAGTLVGQFPKTTFQISLLSPNPFFYVNPESHDYGTVLINTVTNQTFTVMSIGGGTLTVSDISIAGDPCFTLQNLPTLPADLTTGQSFTFTGRYNPTAGGTHTATISITDNMARQTHTIALNGIGLDNTITSLPYTQNFDGVTAPALPIDWSSLIQPVSSTAYVSSVAGTYQSSPNSICIYNGSTLGNSIMLIAPPLGTGFPVNTTRLKFWSGGSGALIIGTLTDPSDATTFQEIQSITLTNYWVPYVVPLNSYIGTAHYIAFKHGNVSTGGAIYMDDVIIEQIFPNDLACTLLTGTLTPTAGNATTYTASVFNWGTITQDTYTVKLYDGSANELASAAGVAVAPGATVQIPLVWTPGTEGSLQLHAQVSLSGDQDTANDNSPVLNITVMPIGTFVVTVGDGSQSERIPLDFYYYNSLQESLYFPAELGMYGNIYALTIYNNFSYVVGNKPVKVWMGCTGQSNLSGGWIPSSQLMLVYDGTVNFPAGQNMIMINLQVPFPYTSGNLVVLFNRPLDTTYYDYYNYFKTQTIGTNRAVNLASYSFIDPAAPAAGTVSGSFAQTTFYMTTLSPDPLFYINPGSRDFGTVLINTTNDQVFTIYNVGGGNLGITDISISGDACFSLQNLPTLPQSLSIGQSISLTARYLPTAAGSNSATVTITDNLSRSYSYGIGNKNGASRAVHNVSLTGTCFDGTLYTLPYEQTFDSVVAPNLPMGWAGLIQPASPTAHIGTSTYYSFSSPNSAQIYNGDVMYTSVILAAPPLSPSIPLNTTRLKFRVFCSFSTFLTIGILTNPSDAYTFQWFQDISLTYTGTFVECIVPFNSYTGTGQCIGFKGPFNAVQQAFYVDNVTIEQLFPNDLACTAITGNATPSVGNATTYNASVINWGTVLQDTYTVKLFDSANTELASATGLSVAPGVTVQVPLVWTPTVQGPAVIYAKVFLPGDQNTDNDQSPNLNISVQPIGTIMVTVGAGNLADGIPLEFYYKSSLYETLYYQSEVGVYGYITTLTFYNNFVTNLPNKPCQFWLGQTELADLSAGWITANNLTQVFSGNINFPSGENMITITLQTPFSYTSGNLVLMAKRPLDTVYFSNSDNFKTQTVGSNRARKLQSDTVDYDPNAPQAVGTLSGTFPKTSIAFVTSGLAALNGVVTSGGTPVPGVNIAVNTTTLQQTTGADGSYNFPFVAPGNYTVTASKLGYETQTLPVILVADQTTTLNFDLVASILVTVNGMVVGSDQPTVGLAGVAITFDGPLDYTGTTDALGQFSVTGVLSGCSYSYSFLKIGYQNLTGNITIGSSGYDMGTLTMVEIACQPGQVSASEGNNQSQVNLCWQPPNPAAQGFNEGFEPTLFPPANWSQIINNTSTPVNTYGVLPTWCRNGVVPTSPSAIPHEGSWQAGIWWCYSHQDEWLITPQFVCPTNADLTFWSFVYYGSVFGGDHYYVKISTNNGATWTILWDATALAGGWNYYTSPIVVGLDAFASQPIKLAWHALSRADNGLGWIWFIDQIIVNSPTKRITFPEETLTIHSASSNDSHTEIGNPSPPALCDMKDDFKLQEQSLQVFNPGNNERVVTGYKVWRLLQGNEANAATWTQLNAEAISDTSLVDSTWCTVPNGSYRWAVKGVYNGGIMSNASFSNMITRTPHTDISALLIQGDNAPAIGVPVTYTILVQNLGNTTLEGASYTVWLKNGTLDLASCQGVTLVPGETHAFLLTWTPTVPGPLTISGLVVMLNDSIPANNETAGLEIIVQEGNVPVELSSFTGNLTADDFVQLTWVTQSETNMLGYRVYRNSSNELASSINLTSELIPATNTSTEHNYNFQDVDVVVGNTYYYWLEGMDMSSSQFFGPISVIVENNQPPELPEITFMKNAYPNPFRAGGNTNLEIAIKGGESGSLIIYNIKGQIIREYSLKEGFHKLIWDGRDSHGQFCGSGIYFYRLSAPTLQQTRKMFLMK